MPIKQIHKTGELFGYLAPWAKKRILDFFYHFFSFCFLRTALDLACLHGHTEFVRALLLYCPDVKIDAQESGVFCAAPLVSCGINIGSCLKFFFFVRQHSVAHCRPPWLCQYCRYDASLFVNALKLPLLTWPQPQNLFSHLLVFTFPIVELLLDHGASIESADFDGKTVRIVLLLLPSCCALGGGK